MTSRQPTTPVVGIIGAGSIGIAFAIVFARSGWTVRIYDPDTARLALVRDEIAQRLTSLQQFELLALEPEVVLSRISTGSSLGAAVADADLVEECAPERVELKTALFAQLEELAPATAILASASSALPVSSFAHGLRSRERCLIAHPVNPPYLIPVIELVPAPFTSAVTIEHAVRIFRQTGMHPIRLGREIEGFVFNRLQGAVLREAYCLVRDGIASVDDIDTLMTEALGMRWSVIGPFETVDLNTRGGVSSHAEKMGPAYERMGAQRGQHDPWTPDLVAQVERQRRALLPLDQWESRVEWRDRALMELARVRKKSASAT